MFKKSIYLLALSLILFSSSSFCQSVDIQGDLKVPDMQQNDNEEMLVTKKADGTLATRNVNSLPTRNFSSDTTRTLGTDMALAKQLCECGTIPPFLAESMLDAGYSVQDLVDGNVPPASLYQGGASLIDLYNAGVSAEEILSIPDVTMLQLLQAGYQGSEFYGLYYQGGLIFQVNPDGSGTVMTTFDVSSSAWYGCQGTGIPGASSTDGQVNTDLILVYCPLTGTAADLCDKLHSVGYSDWYLPSANEYINAYTRIGLDANGPLYNKLNLDPTAKYWSSNNWNNDYALASSTTTLKSQYHRVRAVRKFN